MGQEEEQVVRVSTYGGFSFTREKNVVDLGPIEVTQNKKERVPIPPIAGGVLLVSGVALLAMRSKHA